MLARSTILLAIAATAAGGPADHGTSKSVGVTGSNSTTSSIIVQSHRGAGELAEENTVEAFELGWSMGAYPEADVRMTTDGVIVAFHDADFKRVVRDVPPQLAPLGVEDITWDQLSKLDVGTWTKGVFATRHVPKLTEVFSVMKGHPERHLYMDIKKVDLKELARQVKEYGIGRQVILAAPKYEIIREWKSLVPESDTLMWIGGTESEITGKLKPVREAGFEGITQIQLHVRLPRPAAEIKRNSVNPFNLGDDFLRKTGDELRSRGILYQTLPYGGNTADIYWKLLDLGFQSFATDHPDITLKAVREYRPLAGNGNGTTQ
jgi:glycerophosphoryl diester phosphodiesterase